ncbi:MAG: SAM-dependent methyltransferase [Gammaproteobacteria bacterium]|nr:MAG: SAM-dependent methyltransferase [Gammaproteobacteria bacterium]
MKDKYWLMGPVYDALSFVFAGNSILRCKCSMLTPEHIKPGTKVLFAGVGHGKEAIYAAEQGAAVTVIDLSQAMLGKFEQGMAKTGKTLNIRVVHSDIMTFDEVGRYDMVIANFFLNVFSATIMADVLAHLIALGKENAYIVVGDFALPEGGFFPKLIKNIYWYTAIILFRVTTGAALHPVYDYFDHMKKQGLTMLAKKPTRVFGFNGYTAILGQKTPVSKN